MKNYTRETFKTKEEWLNARGLGGSSASAILGVNPYMSILELYRAIVMPNKHPLERESDSMKYGTRNEPIIRNLFADDFSERYSVRNPRGHEMFRRTDKPYMTATLDGTLTDKKTGAKGVLEIKTHDIRNKADEANWSGHLPDNYYIQVLHYLLVMTDYKFAILTAKLRFFDYSSDGRALSRTEIRYYYIDREDERTKKDLDFLEAKETEFWEENVLKKQVPTMKFKF